MPASAVGTLLIIDDSELVLEVVASGFQEEGWTVFTAETGANGLLIAAKVEEIEAVICDLHLGDISGYDVVDRLAEARPDLPVIMLSGDDDLGAVVVAMRRGAFDYVVKSDLGPLLASAERAVRHYRALRRERALLAQASGVVSALCTIAARLASAGDQATAQELVRLADRLR